MTHSRLSIIQAATTSINLPFIRMDNEFFGWLLMMSKYISYEWNHSVAGKAVDQSNPERNLQVCLSEINNSLECSHFSFNVDGEYWIISSRACSHQWEGNPLPLLGGIYWWIVEDYLVVFGYEIYEIRWRWSHSCWKWLFVLPFPKGIKYLFTSMILEWPSSRDSYV